MPSPRDLLAQNPFTPTSTLAQAIMNTSPLLAELVVVREWLQETAPSPHHPEATTGYWKFTKHSIMQTLRSAGGQRDGLVKEMDPDVVNKGDGRALASDDAVGSTRLVTLSTLMTPAELRKKSRERVIHLCASGTARRGDRPV